MTKCKTYRPFEDARNFVHAIRLNNKKEWMEFAKSENLPKDMSTNPDRVYKDKGWINWGDWLGTGNVSPHRRAFRPFKESRKVARSLGLKNFKEWHKFIKSENLPKDVPTNPDQTFKDKGWINWGDWLGTGTISPHLRVFRSFVNARKFARGLRIKNVREWREFTKSGKLPKDIPIAPDYTYRNKGWVNWRDWLGTNLC